MADTVQESNFFPPLRTSWPHIMRSFCFYSQVHGVHSIREKRPPRVSAARRAGLFSLSLSLFFLRLPQATDPFSPNLAAACFSPSTGFRPPTIRSIVIPRVRCETGSDQIRRRSQGASEWERERESDTKREEEREKALTTVARIDLAPSVIFIAGQKMFSRTLWNEKSISFVLQLQRNWKDVTFGTISSRNFLHGFIM